MSRSLLLGAAALAVLSACGRGRDDEADTTPASDTISPTTAAAATDGGSDKIAQAMSAAPTAIAQSAAIMDWPDSVGGKMKELRAGTNGWVCMPSTPTALQAAGSDPMCLDKTGRAWAAAWSSRKPPRIETVGTAYMLAGDAGASNIDPFASGPTADNEWVKTGPHVMVFTPRVADLAGVPSDPALGGPYMMWRGTPYAHIMVPVGAAPR